MIIYAARILFPVKVLGPGNRVGIWLAGCSHKCPGCSNPELWEKKEKWKVDVGLLIKIVKDLFVSKGAQGVTITGGDPFEQPESLKELLSALSDITDDILVYSGYDYPFLKEKYPDVLKYIGVLIDGLYKEELNFGLRLRGSENQNIIYLKQELKERYEEFLVSEHADIQNFAVGSGVISVGIHLPDFNRKIQEKAKMKGLLHNGQNDS